jgi:hypothetical protein
MTQRNIILPAVLLVLLPWALVFATGQAEGGKQTEVTTLTIAGGPQGGGWYGLAGNVANECQAAIPGTRFSVMPGGGVGNVTLVEKGEVQLGLTVSHLFASARLGNEPYPDLEAQHIRALAEVGTSDECLLLVRRSLPFDTIDQMIESEYPLKLTTTSKASTPALGAARLFEEYGISFEDLEAFGGKMIFTSYADATKLIADGHADGIIAPAVPAITELIRSVDMKLIPIDEEVVESMAEKYGYAKNFLPKGKYEFVEQDGWAVGSPNVIIVRDDVPEDIVYQITKTICEKPDIIRSWGKYHAEFDPRTAWKNVGGPLHPGAKRYYGEMGYMK